MTLLIKNADIITTAALLNKSLITIEKNKIASIGCPPRGKSVSIIDAQGYFVAPGFIDMHIHGDPGEIALNEPKYGTTSAVIAVSCDRPDKIFKEVERIRLFSHNCPNALNILGVHIEGPYINKVRAGAQKKAYIRKPDPGELLGIIKKCGGLLKLMTVAPEIGGAGGIIKILKSSSVVASIGHSNATFSEAVKGIRSGIRHATHIFNCMPSIDRREPGAAGAVLLDERVTAEVIFDRIHVHEALFKILLKIKGRDKIVLVTDSVRSERIESVNKYRGAYRFKDGTIAGSGLTMSQALKNAVKHGGLSLIDAVKLATENPAGILGIGRHKGSIRPGMDADMVILDKEFDVKLTMVNGKEVYRKPGF